MNPERELNGRSRALRPRPGPGGWRSLGLPATLAMTVMCGGTPASRHVADRFMALYYDQSHVGEAVQLCTGAAKARLEEEIKFMKGVPAAALGERPHVTFRLRAQETPTGAQATYVYRVHLGTPEVRALFAKLVLVHEGGQWLVSRFDEKERAS